MRRHDVNFMYEMPPGMKAPETGANGEAPKMEIGEDRKLSHEEKFKFLKGAPKEIEGSAPRVQPFGMEQRNVKCMRCKEWGHQHTDVVCPLFSVAKTEEELEACESLLFCGSCSSGVALEVLLRRSEPHLPLVFTSLHTESQRQRSEDRF